MQAVNLSVDHKPELELEKERINKAGGFIHGGRVNGSLNLTRAIGMSIELQSEPMFLLIFLFCYLWYLLF